MIQTAFDRGITFYDAAEAYGPHEVERILGEGVAPFRDKVAIASKSGWNIDLETAKTTSSTTTFCCPSPENTAKGWLRSSCAG
ncbi:aldo/keto reductase [Nostoc sp.]|uniref:aldo/keto reductase n=1 Tax=Nostoc sp. TaxID=1180 RepID=UPI003FA5B81A